VSNGGLTGDAVGGRVMREGYRAVFRAFRIMET